jgi:hypothetical protein
VILVHRHGARGDEGPAGDHPLPPVLDGNHPPVGNSQVRLVVHAVQALHHRLLDLLDAVGRLARLGLDLEDRVVMDLGFEALRPAAVAPQPGTPLLGKAFVHTHPA